MVPPPDSTYFPSLEKCLDGDQLLISWEAVSTTLYDAKTIQRPHRALEEFLADPYVLQSLARPYDIFSFGNGNQAKSAFETKTAAINVTPTAKKEYSIAEVKEDALWLSKTAGIDEISALRIIVLEYQSRARTQLQSEFSDEERVSLQEVGGNLSTDISVALPLATVITSFASTEAGSPRATNATKERALKLFLSERRSLIKCAGLCLEAALDVSKGGAEVSNKGKNKGKSRVEDLPWLQRVGQALLETFDKEQKNMQAYLSDSIRTLKSGFEKMEKGSGWFEVEDVREEFETQWLNSQIVEATYTLEIIFRIVDSQDMLSSADIVTEWYKFVGAYGFFDQFETPFPSSQELIPALQSLISVISLALLNPQRMLDDVEAQNSGFALEDGSKQTSYMSDLQTMTDVHQILAAAASKLSPLASPAILAWSLMLKTLRDTDLARKETREVRQSVRAEQSIEDNESIEEESPTGSRRRRSSVGSEGSLEPGIYDVLLEEIKDITPDEDPILYFGSSAIEGCKVFDVLTSLATLFSPPSYLDSMGARVRLCILLLTRYSIEIMNYTPEVVTTVLAVLVSDQSFWDLLEYPATKPSEDILNFFMRDDYLVQMILDTAASRYPYESLPFLKLIRAVASCKTLDDEGAPVAMGILEHIPSFTFQLPQDFRSYETIREEDNANTIQLTDEVVLFQPRIGARMAKSSEVAYGESRELVAVTERFSIPKGTPGRIISDFDTGPKVAMWYQEYSTLKYIGKLLETAMTSAEFDDAVTGGPVDRELVAEMIGLLATLLLSTSQIADLKDTSDQSNAVAYHILEEASDGLCSNRDIVYVIFRIFEEELQRQSSNLESEAPLDILIASVQFIFALTPFLPGRVWPLLGRCGLLDIDGQGGRLSSIVGRVEMVKGTYDFLISCTYLFYALVEDSVRNAVLRKSGSKALTRQGHVGDLGTGVPEQMLSKILLSMTRTLVDVFESACNWRFAIEKQRLQLPELISTVLQSILQHAYGVDDSSASDSKLTKPLVSAAEYIIDTFLATVSPQSRFRPILRLLLEGFTQSAFTPQSGIEARRLGTVKAGLVLANTLVRTGILINRPASQLESYLFKVSPLVARLYAIDKTYHLHVIKLLEALVLSASSRDSEPPSLLGHLGPTTSKHFIRTVLDLDQPLDEERNVIAVWHMLSVVISSRQQWFSMYLLTGRPPRQSVTNGPADSGNAQARTLLRTALTALSTIENVPLPRALAMLQFISLAQNFWPWAMSDIQLKKYNFISSIMQFVDSLEAGLRIAKAEQSLEVCYKTRMAAYIAEILAMYVYHARQMGDSTPKGELLPHIGFYVALGASAPLYNPSLHGNFRGNFQNKFIGCSVQNFKRTKLEIREYGRKYFYDLDLAGRMLRSDKAWTGLKGDGLAEEMARANVNLSVVDAQVALLHAWKLLAIELTEDLSAQPKLQADIVRVIKECLKANRKSQLPENIFMRLNQTRADFALTLLQRLVEAKCDSKEILSLLPTIWATILDMESSFEQLITSSEADYFRSLLRLLYLALCSNTNAQPSQANGTKPSLAASKDANALSKPVSSEAQIIVSIIKKIVAEGFRALVAGIHEKPADSVADDIALVTAILQACLRFPGVEMCYTQILDAMASCDTIRVAITLYSWSDKLAIEGDPIYGELSVLFLLELSSIPVIAEQLAVEGTLGHISNANITSYIRDGKATALAEGFGPQRCYRLWVRGILPLVLNILTAVGATIATEVSLFMSQFPKVLEQSVNAIEPPPTSFGRTASPARVTYNMVSEVHTTALILYALNMFRLTMAGISEIREIKRDHASVLDSVEHWLTERMVLRERILPIGFREMEMAKQKPLSAGTGSENRLEEKVVQELMGIKAILTGGDV